MTTSPRGRATFRIAAVFFALSAALELLTLQGETPLFGVLVGGTAAVPYHALYAGLFAWLGVALWNGHRSGFYVLLATTLLYTVDRVQLLFTRAVVGEMVQKGLAGHEDILQMVGLEYVLNVMAIMTVVILLCWWGFAGYAYVRRDYFGIERSPRISA